MYSRFHVQKGSNTMNKSPNKTNKNVSNKPKKSTAIAAAYQFLPKRQVPSSKELGQGKVLVKGSEFISTINGSVSFSATRIQCNPGLSTFTWLSAQALKYERYRWRKIHYEYIPAEAVTTTAGTIYMVADYDPTDAAPSSLSNLATYETQCEARVWSSCTLVVNERRLNDNIGARKVRCGPVAGDLSIYDGLSVSYGTISCANTNAIGQLWVHYEIELISPQTTSNPTPNSLVQYNRSTNQTMATTVATVLQFDQAIIDTLSMTPATGVFTPPCGLYTVEVDASIYDTASETFNSFLELQQNSAALTIPCYSECQSSQVASAPIHNHKLTRYLYCNGTDTVRLLVTLTGAAGTLSCLANKCRIVFRLVQ